MELQYHPHSVLVSDRGHTMDQQAGGFQAPRTITPQDLGNDLARLVWESFSDFITETDPEAIDASLELTDEEGHPDQRAVEESLIFLLWAHTRAAQQAFVTRAPGPLLKEALDELHNAVFEDMVENGTPESHMPLFEQRVSARYSEYHQAASASDGDLGRAVVRHMTARPDASDPLTEVVTERALAVAGPLRDYLEDVELISA